MYPATMPLWTISSGAKEKTRFRGIQPRYNGPDGLLQGSYFLANSIEPAEFPARIGVMLQNNVIGQLTLRDEVIHCASSLAGRLTTALACSGRSSNQCLVLRRR